MTLYTYLIERLEKYRSLNPIEFQELESELTTKLTYHIEQNIAIIDQYPLKIEFKNHFYPHGTCITMHNSYYRFDFIVNVHESNIALVGTDNGKGYYHKLDQLIDWVCRIFNFEYRNNCFTPKSFNNESQKSNV